MADPAFPPIEPDLAARLELLAPPALPADFSARLAAMAQATPQVPPHAPLPAVRPAGRWHAIGRRTRLGIAAGSLGLIGLGSVSAAAAGYLGEPVNHAVHRIPVVGKLIEKVIPEKRRHHHAEADHAAGLGHATGHETPGKLKIEPRPAAAFAPPLIVPDNPLPVIAVPGVRAGGFRNPPPWRYPGPLPSTFPPGPERRAAAGQFRAFRAAHPLPPEVIERRRQRQAAIIAARRANPDAPKTDLQGPLPRWRALPASPPDPFATAIRPDAAPPRPDAPPHPGSTLPGASRPVAEAPAFRPPVLDPIAREQLRIERRRARIEARRQGLDPLAPGIGQPRNAPGQGSRTGEVRPLGPAPGPAPGPASGPASARARRIWRRTSQTRLSKTKTARLSFEKRAAFRHGMPISARSRGCWR